MPTYEKLSVQEKAFHDATMKVVEKHGKFGVSPGVYVQYEPPAKNEDKDKGIKCGNCSFYAGGEDCAIIVDKVDAGGRCRFVTIPEELVNYDTPEKKKTDAVNLAMKMGAETKSAKY
jgi:hypothetical protein